LFRVEKEQLFVSIDPGVHKSALAIWSSGILLYAEDLPNKEALSIIEPIASRAYLVIEKPVLYPTKRKQHKDVKNLLKVVELFLKVAHMAKTVQPSVWKGQVPKKIHGPRIVAVLSNDEKKGIDLKNHNTVDAIGLGLWALKRLARGGA